MSNNVNSINETTIDYSERYLDRPKLLMMAVGTFVGSGLVSLTGVAAGETGYSVWLAFAVAVILGFISALPFVLMSSVMNFRGGTYSIATTFIGERFGGAFAFLNVLNGFGLAIMATAFGIYLNSILPSISIKVGAVIILFIMWFANIMGIEFLSTIQKYSGYILIVSLAVFCIFSFRNLNPEVFNFSGPDFFTNGSAGFLSAIALLIFSCQSYDTNVYTFGRYTIEPKKNMPWAMFATAIALLFIYTLVSIAAVGAVDLETFAGKPLTDSARAVLPGILFYIFIITGPIMCLVTTVNGYMGSLTIGLAKACEDNWLPRSLAKTNKNDAYYILVTIITIVCLIPVLAGLDIGAITNITVGIGSLFHIPLLISMMKLPNKFPEEFKNSSLNWLTESNYKICVILALLVRLFITVISIIRLTNPVKIALFIAVIACFVFSFVRYNSGKVEVEDNYFFN